ncbi:hypothetical protein HanRHA438_Chr03g0145661 [Helianthus annuus]|nr:hypothetical protein HanRHA438_Chr03g0145661 [Helianthus annuus]
MISVFRYKFLQKLIFRQPHHIKKLRHFLQNPFRHHNIQNLKPRNHSFLQTKHQTRGPTNQHLPIELNRIHKKTNPSFQFRFRYPKQPRRLLKHTQKLILREPIRPKQIQLSFKCLVTQTTNSINSMNQHPIINRKPHIQHLGYKLFKI